MDSDKQDAKKSRTSPPQSHGSAMPIPLDSHIIVFSLTSDHDPHLLKHLFGSLNKNGQLALESNQEPDG